LSLKRGADGTSAGLSRSVGRPAESLETFEERTLSAVFRITLDEANTTDMNGVKLRYLPGVRGDLEEQQQPIRISVGVLDQALLEAASSLKNKRPLTYLMPCWKRVSRLYRGFKKAAGDDAKYEVVKEARRLCLSYCIFSVTMPEMFGCVYFLFQSWQPETINELTHNLLSVRLDTPSSSPLKSHLLLDAEDDQGLCQEFLTEVVRRAEEDEAIVPAFVTAIEELSRELAKMTMNSDYKPYVGV
jgi:ubiquitin conjugation factor E4 B